MGQWARNPDLVHKFFMCQIGVGQAKRGSVFRFTVNGVVSENGIYGHSRFCNTDFDDKLACLNLSGV